MSVLLRPGVGPSDPGRARLGFRALPAPPKQDYREFYFFSHAVRVREKDERIGEMLVKDGDLFALP